MALLLLLFFRALLNYLQYEAISVYEKVQCVLFNTALLELMYYFCYYKPYILT